MTTNQVILVDLLVSVLAAAGWLGAGGALAAGRPVLARAALAAAVAFSLGRIVSTGALVGSGWWFVQEKVVFTLPVLVVAGGIAGVVVARTRLSGKHAVLALFTAGYAALAGPMVTVLSGCPLAGAAALIALAALGFAATVTARVLSIGRLRASTVASAAAAVIGAVLVLAAPVATDSGGGRDTAAPDPPASVASIVGPTSPEAGGEVRRFTLTAKKATVTLGSGRPVAAWTFNGRVPGPALTATVGDLIEVTLRNDDIADGVTLHWHGYDVPAADDGAPGLTQDAVKPGQEFVYRFLAAQPGTYWYHTHEVSDTGVRLGLYGALVVHPRGTGVGLDLTEAIHTFEGSTVLGADDQPTTRTVAAGTPVRLRLINTDSTPRTAGVVGVAVTVTSIDGTDLNAPTPLRGTALLIAAGARYDVEFAMPDHPVALRIAAARAELTLTPGGASAVPGGLDGWPVLDPLNYGAPAATSFGPDSSFDRTFTLVLDRGLAVVNGAPRYAYTVNGRAFPHIATETVREGDLVRFTLVNRSHDIHPWHLHGHRVLVLSRDGARPTGSPLWLDTFDVGPGEVWQIGFRADNPGIWMNHCHNLRHADDGMALHFAYDGVESTFHGGHGG